MRLSPTSSISLRQQKESNQIHTWICHHINQSKGPRSHQRPALHSTLRRASIDTPPVQDCAAFTEGGSSVVWKNGLGSLDSDPHSSSAGRCQPPRQRNIQSKSSHILLHRSLILNQASYSNIPVIEMTVGDVAAMKRVSDNCLNATQILKVAGIDKGRRTKILEKEIITGPHEKVQGGYGKYQGTWYALFCN